MLIKTDIKLKDMFGKELAGDDPLTLGKALGNILGSSEEGGKMKLFILGSKLCQEENVEVDEADLNLIKNAVKKTKIYNAIVSGQCEFLLENVKEDEVKE